MYTCFKVDASEKYLYVGQNYPKQFSLRLKPEILNKEPSWLQCQSYELLGYTDTRSLYINKLTVTKELFFYNLKTSTWT